MIYYNLGQLTGDHVVYIRSTDVEQMNWHRLLWSVPDEWFYRWSIGDAVFVKDVTSNPRGGKVKRIFAPVLLDVLNVWWYEQQPRSRQLKDHYAAAVGALRSDNQLYTRYHLWKRKVTEIELLVLETIVEREPNAIHATDHPTLKIGERSNG